MNIMPTYPEIEWTREAAAAREASFATPGTAKEALNIQCAVCKHEVSFLDQGEADRFISSSGWATTPDGTLVCPGRMGAHDLGRKA